MKTKSRKKATNWPKVIIRLLTVTKDARQAVGAASAMYTGATTEAKPIPRPVRSLPEAEGKRVPHTYTIRGRLTYEILAFTI